MNDALFDFYNLFVNNNLLEDLYQEELLGPLTFSMLGIVVVVAFLFYIWPNRVSFTGMGHWVLMMLASAIAVFVMTLVTCYQKKGQQLPRDEADTTLGLLFDQETVVFLSYALQMFALTAVLFFVVSMLMKTASRNAKHRPVLWPSK